MVQILSSRARVAFFYVDRDTGHLITILGYLDT
jgi:hypothetical protein